MSNASDPNSSGIGVHVSTSSPELEPGVAALQEVDRAGHGAEVDAFPRRAALHVVDIAEQRLDEQIPRCVAVEAGVDPGVDAPG